MRTGYFGAEDLRYVTLLVHLISQIVKRDRKDYIIALSKEFSVVSKFTSFVAIEHREKVIFSR